MISFRALYVCSADERHDCDKNWSGDKPSSPMHLFGNWKANERGIQEFKNSNHLFSYRWSMWALFDLLMLNILRNRKIALIFVHFPRHEMREEPRRWKPPERFRLLVRCTHTHTVQRSVLSLFVVEWKKRHFFLLDKLDRATSWHSWARQSKSIHVLVY